MTFLESQDSTLFAIKQNGENSVRGSTVRQASGLMNFAAAVAYHFCLGLPTALTQPWAHLLAEPCIEKCPACLWDKKFIPRGYWIWYTLLFIMSTGLKSFWRSPCACGAGRGRGRSPICPIHHSFNTGQLHCSLGPFVWSGGSGQIPMNTQ